MFRVFLTLFLIQAPAQAAEFSLEELSSLIFHSSAAPVRNVEDVLALLPESLRTQYVLMVDSRSLQESSRQSPRVILFAKDGSGMLSFNGGQEGFRGANTLEVIARDPGASAAATYTLAEFVFGEQEFQDTPFRRSENVSEFRNPRKCQGCHGVGDSRPIWEPIPEWPGALPQSSVVSAEDEAYLSAFVDSGAQHPRYRQLLRRENLSAMQGSSMAFQLDQILETARKDWLLKNIRGSRDFGQFSYALMGALSACTGIEDFMPEVIRARFNASRTRAELVTEVRERVALRAPLHEKLFSFTPEGAEIVGNLRWLLEPRGINSRYWGMSLLSPYLFATNAASFYPDLIELLAEENKVEMPRMAVYRMLLDPAAKERFLTPHDVDEQKVFCGELKTLSLKQF